MTIQPDYDHAIEYALEQLRCGLPAHLTYHNMWHTINDVMPAAVRLAQLCQVAPQEMHLIKVAAAYHDVGFVYTYGGHELASARVAAQILPEYGFTDRQIEQIMGMIMTTQLPQTPRNLLEEIIADADLDTLGREEDFFERREALRQELVALGRPLGKREWYTIQLNFVSSHTYFTEAARALRTVGKQKIIAVLKGYLQGTEG